MLVRSIIRILLLFGSVCAAAAPTLGQVSQEELLQLIRKNGLERTREQVQAAAKKFPDQPGAAFFDAALEPEGREAKVKYEEVIRRWPHSDYALRARLRVAKYHFSLGEYRTAHELFGSCIELSKDPETASEASYFAARSLFAIGEREEAAAGLQALIRRYPQSSFVAAAVEDLQVWNNQLEAASFDVSSERRGDEPYTVQIGAFTEEANALSQKDYFAQQGVPVEISRKEKADRTFYLVWVGRFSSEDEARQYGEAFQRRFKKPFQVVEVREEP